MHVHNTLHEYIVMNNVFCYWNGTKASLSLVSTILENLSCIIIPYIMVTF
jgi:hypothetical protein